MRELRKQWNIEKESKSLQVLDIGDSSESFPGNRLDLVLTQVSGEKEEEQRKKNEFNVLINTFIWMMNPNHRFVIPGHTQTHVIMCITANYSGKAGGQKQQKTKTLA